MPPRDADAASRSTATKATSGAWRSTSTPASAATRAWSPARPRTTSRSSARSRSLKRPRDALAARRPLLPRATATNPETVLPAGAVHALRERAVRGRLPGRGHRAQRRRPERHGLQPLRRHAVLLEQLPVQGPALQLPPLPGLGDAQPASLARNPDVTVRSRGVMEKCTYCVQRINEAKIEREKDRPARSATARSRPPARQACPTEAIVFGDLNDRERAASRSCRPRRATTRCSPSSTPGRARPIWRRSATSNPELGE